MIKVVRVNSAEQRAPLPEPPQLTAEDISQSDFAAGCCEFLDAIETFFHCMVVGIGRFLTVQFPRWLIGVLRAVVRVSMKATRVCCYALTWASISFGPMVTVWFGPPWMGHMWVFLVALLWAAFALAGSVCGLIHVRRRAAHRAEKFGEALSVGA